VDRRGPRRDRAEDGRQHGDREPNGRE